MNIFLRINSNENEYISLLKIELKIFLRKIEKSCNRNDYVNHELITELNNKIIK
jgi:hypothetical protein